MKKYVVLLIIVMNFMGIKNTNAQSISYLNSYNQIILSNIFDYNMKDYVKLDGEEENAPAISEKSPCVKLKSPLKFIGYILLIIKIVIPLLLIIFGIIDLFKAVTGGKDGEITKSLKTFMFRLIAGVAIFFIPTIISFVFSLVDGFDDVESEFNVCQKCILNLQCD